MNQIKKYISVLEKTGLDALLLTSQTNRYYAATYDVAEGVAVITRTGSWYITDSRYLEAAQKHLDGFTLLQNDQAHSFSMLIGQALAEAGAKTLGIEEQYLTLAEYESYRDALDAQLVPCQEELTVLRYVKEPWELELLDKAQQITDATFTELLGVIRAGMTEKELAAELIYRLYKLGGEGLAFDPIVVSGPNSSLPHGVPSDRVIQPGDFITMDFGAKFGGYCADMTRTVALGYATDEMKTVYNTVLKAQLAGIAVSKAGVLGKTVHEAAAQVIRDAGYGPYFGHGYGHGVGIEIHESPSCNQRGEVPMPVGAVCSAEPGIYLPDKFGVRIEDVVVFQSEGCRVLTQSPKELIIL